MKNMEPWMKEADYEEFSVSGLICRIRRNPSMMNLCGYVVVPPNHPLFGVGYSQPLRLRMEPSVARALATHGENPSALKSDLVTRLLSGPISLDELIAVHGGVTFAEEYDDDWEVGFDCAHYGDYVPAMREGGVYRDLEFVRGQCVQLAEQIAFLGNLRVTPIEGEGGEERVMVRVRELLEEGVSSQDILLKLEDFRD